MAEKTSLVFYDATCVLCDRSILWLIKNDPEGVLRFTHVASEIAKKQVFPVLWGEGGSNQTDTTYRRVT